MIRAPLCGQDYWDTWIKFIEQAIKNKLERIKQPSGNPRYRPQYVYGISQDNYEQILRRYSRGDAVMELKQYFAPMLDAWEQSERLGLDVYSTEQQFTRNNWTVNLDHYIVCFWLVGLALSLEIPDDQWRRLLALIGNEGNDILLDNVIATRQPNRKIGDKLCHPKPYQRLLDTMNAPVEQQPMLLAAFVEHWYVELNRLPKNKKLSEDTMAYERPYWYKYGAQNINGGAYFGQWCVEAVAVVKAFKVDDNLCIGHPQYPGDLLRPNKVTPPDMKRLPKPLREWLNKKATETQVKIKEEEASLITNIDKTITRNWLQRLFGKAR